METSEERWPVQTGSYWPSYINHFCGCWQWLIGCFLNHCDLNTGLSLKHNETDLLYKMIMWSCNFSCFLSTLMFSTKSKCTEKASFVGHMEVAVLNSDLFYNELLKVHLFSKKGFIFEECDYSRILQIQKRLFVLVHNRASCTSAKKFH